MDKKIRIILNGQEAEIPKEATISILIDLFDERETHLIVERNGRCVYPTDYATTAVSPGDRIELIHPAFGG